MDNAGEDPELLLDQAVELVRADEVEAAEPVLVGAVNAGAERAGALLGFLYLETGQLELAEHLWRGALEWDNAWAWSPLGTLLQVTGRAAEAEEMLRRSAETTGDRKARTSLGILCQVTGRAEEGVTWLRAATEQVPDDPFGALAFVMEPTPEQASGLGHDGLMAELSKALSVIGHHASAGYWARMAAQSGRGPTMHEFARTLLRHDRPRTAELWLRRAAEAGYAAAMHDYGTLLRHTGRRREARPWLRRSRAAFRRGG
ncbi:tetratricopeptide repeat protein [Streptomyces aidingensis]|uniref:Tetratricopeptide repeat-containing protein n=1 Tax=Streptomyces aidingensis TaxID=910347 RepID=A0A1I1E3R9_9ACTN|nr:tetratricopeptide repeat protein [Streptomyces aidingensis]SFB79868.1 Tetratricopeptide repeat-containing protein [Streptomyces aidingensis]